MNTPISAVRQPALILSQSSSGPIRLGESFPVQITLANHGVSQAKDITVRVKETGSSLAPLQTNAFHIEKLKQGEKSSGEITFNTDKNIKPAIHKIPVEIQYTTPDKGEIGTSETLSLDVRGEADVSLMSIETDPSRIMKNTPFDLVIRLDNQELVMQKQSGLGSRFHFWEIKRHLLEESNLITMHRQYLSWIPGNQVNIHIRCMSLTKMTGVNMNERKISRSLFKVLRIIHLQ